VEEPATCAFFQIRDTINELPLPRFELLKTLILVRAGECCVSSLIGTLTLETASTSDVHATLRRHPHSIGSSSIVGANFDAKRR
jgi:hypothetical protein